MKKFISTVIKIISKVILFFLCIGAGTWIIYQGHDKGFPSMVIYFLVGMVIWPFALIPFNGLHSFLNFWIWLLSLNRCYYPEFDPTTDPELSNE